MHASAEHAVPPKPRPRRWYRLHSSTWLVTLIVASVLVTLNVSGFIRIGGKDLMDVEWQNGWPVVFFQRHHESASPAAGKGATLPVSLPVDDDDLDAALRELLFGGGELTLRLLGFSAQS